MIATPIAKETSVIISAIKETTILERIINSMAEGFMQLETMEGNADNTQQNSVKHITFIF